MKKQTAQTPGLPIPTPRSGIGQRKVLPFVCLVCAAAMIATGCSALSYTSPAGEHFSRVSLGTKTAIAALKVEAGTNGVRRLELQGYQNDSNQALSTVTEAAVRAAVAR